MRGTMRAFVSKAPQRLKSPGQIIAAPTARRTARVKPKP
jgi:hypothetical protein